MSERRSPDLREYSEDPECAKLLRVAEAVAVAASRNIQKLEELIKNKRLDAGTRIIISNAVDNIHRAQEIAYGLSEEEAKNRYISPQSAIEEVQRIREDLGLTDLSMGRGKREVEEENGAREREIYKLKPPEWHDPPSADILPQFTVTRVGADQDEYINFKTLEDALKYITEIKTKNFKGKIRLHKNETRNAQGAVFGRGLIEIDLT